MSGNTKDKIAVRNNAGKTTPAATAPMANAYANATVLEKIENLAPTFRHRKLLKLIAAKRLIKTLSGNTKDKIAVRNNAGNTTPTATAPMANAYANATVLEKIENLARDFSPQEVQRNELAISLSKHKGKR
ncbi:hypothetical protein F2Q69_00028852 [Brassica cretica]|uniref:Uncharacterized protein n=1 Tax=Brassica cretica TaxID=69181 RepID=A0A8S9S7F6_BRACR|nr:hypothetical protein F2Q69_00028852 [Brassica cretica]